MLKLLATLDLSLEHISTLAIIYDMKSFLKQRVQRFNQGSQHKALPEVHCHAPHTTMMPVALPHLVLTPDSPY
jgi:hypothetical protein